MTRSPTPLSAGRGGALIPALLAGLVLAALSFALIDWYAGYRADLAERGWNRSMGSWDELMRRYPPREANAAALELERLAAALGIDLAPQSAEGRVRPSAELAAAIPEIKSAAGNYIQDQIERPHRQVDSPPPKLAAFLDANRGELDAIQDALLHGDAPCWELRLDLGFSAPIPNLLGQLDLQRLILADALAHGSRGDQVGARAGLEASWNLNRALRNDPTVITQMITINVARMQIGALRQLDVEPDLWLERLSARSFRGPFLAALRLEARTLTTLDDHECRMDDERLSSRRLMAIVGRPYARLCLATVGEEYRRRLDRLAEAKTLCSGSPADLGVDLEIPVPRWNVLGRLVMPFMDNQVERLARLELDLELSARLLELEAERAARGGRWPAEVAGLESSAACPGARWDYRVDPTGGMTLAYSRELDWNYQPGAILPTRIRVDP